MPLSKLFTNPLFLTKAIVKAIEKSIGLENASVEAIHKSVALDKATVKAISLETAIAETVALDEAVIKVGATEEGCGGGAAEGGHQGEDEQAHGCVWCGGC